MKEALLLSSILLLVQVATAQTCNDAIPESTPESRFTLNGDEVTDIETGLIWQRCSLGQTGSDCSAGIATTHNWQEALLAANAPWRLPNIKELESIVEEKCGDPAINLVIFPNTASLEYWSASSFANGSGNAWYIYFESGNSSNFDKLSNFYVRLVRDEQ